MALTVTDILKFRESESDPWQRLLLQANINFNLIYPVGSIYMSTVNVNPATLFGGTWEQLENRFLLGAGTTYTAGDTGGAETHHHSTANHTLTVSEIPSHTHGIKGWRYGHNQKYDNYSASYTQLSDAASSSTPILATGGGQPHNHGDTGDTSNMPPYIVVYMWKRLTLSPSLTPLPMNVLGDVASEDIVPVSKGGTGADNAADARLNLGVVAGLGEIATATFPFTAPSDGILYYRFTASSSSSTSYVYLRRTSPSALFIAQHQSSAGMAITGNLVVKKGWVIEVSYISNAVFDTASFVPLE